MQVATGPAVALPGRAVQFGLAAVSARAVLAGAVLAGAVLAGAVVTGAAPAAATAPLVPGPAVAIPALATDRPTVTPSSTVTPGKPTVTPAQKTAAIVGPAVVYLEVRWQGWVRDKKTGQLWDPGSVSITTSCTGFAVSNDGYIVTAGRCVDPGVEGVAQDFFAAIAERYYKAGTITAEQRQDAITDMIAAAEVGGETADQPVVRQVFAQRGTAKMGLTTGEAIPAQVVSVQPASKGDVGLIKIEKSNQPMVTLADPADVKLGTDVLAIGYAAPTDSVSEATLEPSTEAGKIDELPTQGAVAPYETSATTQGMSAGAPVTNLNGDIVGLVSHAPASQQPTVDQLVGSSVISQTLAKAGVQNKLGKVDNDFRRGLDDYYAGRYTPAIEAFDQVLAAVPSHAQAQDYRQQAVSRRTAMGEQPPKVSLGLLGDFSKGGMVAVTSAVVVVLAAGVLLFWRRRRNRPAPALATSTSATSTTARSTIPTSTIPTSTAATSNTVTSTTATSTQQAAPALRYCSNCGHGWQPGTTVCATCGQQLR